MKVTTIPSPKKGLWTVRLDQGAQRFTLAVERNKAEAQWYARMFRLALKRHDEAKQA